MAPFEELKEIAISAHVLTHPSPDGMFTLDASNNQIGAELSQVKNGVIKPICYVIHVLLKQHRKRLRNFWP